MKRTIALVVLLASLGILLKIGLREGLKPGPARLDTPYSSHFDQDDNAAEAALLARYPDSADRAVVERTLRKFKRNAVQIERTDGLRGLVLLDRLDLEAVYLYERHREEFQRLRENLNDNAAAEILLRWRDYFGLKRVDDADRRVLIEEVSRLDTAARRAAARWPAILPLILAEPRGMVDLLDRLQDAPNDLAETLAVLNFVSLESGTADLRIVLRTFERHRELALQAFRFEGLDGIALVRQYGSVIKLLGDALPLDQALALLRVNAAYIDQRLETQSAETVAADLRHVAAAGLVAQVGSTPNGLRLIIEFGRRGELALQHAGSDAAVVIYADFDDQPLRRVAVEALANYGTSALAILDKYAADPDFRAILREYGEAVIPPIAQTDATPAQLAALRAKPRWSLTERFAAGVLALSGDSGQATIRTIKADGLERVAELTSTDVDYYQFLPLYDVIHLSNVIRRGHAPTWGEAAWAALDAAFVIADALSLASVQPEGAVAAEAARTELKTATRETLKTMSREAGEAAAEAGTRSLIKGGIEGASPEVVRWWVVRVAGGSFELLRRMPAVLPRLTLPELTELARPLCGRAGITLTRWKPLRFLRAGTEVVFPIPPRKGMKYMAEQAVHAGVGFVGFQKMEEFLASRRVSGL